MRALTRAPDWGTVGHMKLSSYMTLKGLRDGDLAAALGECSIGAIRKWRSGERIPRPEMMARIRRATDGQVTPDDFIFGDEAEPQPAEAEAGE